MRCKQQALTCEVPLSLCCLGCRLPVPGSRGCRDGALQMRVWREAGVQGDHWVGAAGRGA